jgi:hypothetical protein
MESTITKAEEKLRGVREGVSAGVDDSRDKAADALERAGRAVRSGSRRMGRATEKRGQRVGREMERRARVIRPASRRGALGYMRRHPLQVLLLLGLVTGVVAVAFIPRMIARGAQTYEDYEPLGPMV